MKAENQSGQKLKILRTDGGGEYNSIEFQKYMMIMELSMRLLLLILLNTMVLLNEEIVLCLI